MNRAQLNALLATHPSNKTAPLPYIVPKDSPKPAAVQELAPGAVHIGQSTDNGGPVGFDLGKLIEGRLLIQGNSGAGKSMLLRRLFEQAFGRIQQVLVDPDGEFSTLADHFDVAVVTAADALRIGGRAFALHLREHRYSVVLDLSDATSEERLQLVADLAAGLIAAPELHWHPLLVLIDEAQTMAPHYDTGDVEADTRKQAIAALADLMGRGRKRGLCGVIATQRLAETSKAVVSKATNIVVGRTIFDRDLERAGALLGFTLGHSRALRSLGDGEFLGIGPAIAGPRRVRFRAGPVQSRHKGAAPEVVAPPRISASAAAALLQQVPTSETQVEQPRKGRRGRGWDRREDEIIAEGYREKLEVREIVDRLEASGFRRRSVSGVSGRARDLGLRSERAKSNWSDAEDQIIADGYAREVKIADIVTLLAEAGFDRGRVAVQMRAIGLGITRDRVNYWTEPEKAIAVAGLEAGKPYREILEDLRQAGFHRGLTGIFKFAQKNNYCRAADSWTAADIETLRLRYEAKVPVKEIAAELGKTEAGIRTKASLLGYKQRVPWSEAERQILIDGCAAGELLIHVAAKIGRPYPNVAAEAKRMELSFRRVARPEASDPRPVANASSSHRAGA
ncbi:MAG TPA: DUF87 domain-containing protein [Devosiaceae bacterium]|jgi:GTPase SAR1 family protein|nr:DUF87 domain-containing protein [Devosiaceae bacterium]